VSRTRRSMFAGAKDVAPIVLGVIPFGLVTGAAVADAGMGVTEALGMSLLVNAGASQLTATALYSEHAPLLVAIGTALVVNARLFIYSTSLAPVIDSDAGRWRWALGHPLIDQSYAVTMLRGRYLPDIGVVPYYVGAWLALAAVWQVTNVVGVLAGSFVPASWSLDFAVPLVFLALLVPALTCRVDAEVAAVSAIAAAVLVPLLPMQTGLLAAIVLGMVWGAARKDDASQAGVGQ